MIFLSRVLKPSHDRWANTVAAVITHRVRRRPAGR